jgi:hypothetical protein
VKREQVQYLEFRSGLRQMFLRSTMSAFIPGTHKLLPQMYKRFHPVWGIYPYPAQAYAGKSECPARRASWRLPPVLALTQKASQSEARDKD